MIPGGPWDNLDEETKFFLVLQVELPSEAAFSRIFDNCPAVTLTTFQGARVTREAPDWIQFAWDGLVFWQPRTLILELVSSAARLERDTDLRNRLYDWTRCVSVSVWYYTSNSNICSPLTSVLLWMPCTRLTLLAGIALPICAISTQLTVLTWSLMKHAPASFVTTTTKSPSRSASPEHDGFELET